MPSRLAFPVNDNYDRCPICRKDPKTCPHSLGQMAERLWEDWVRRIVREEMSRAIGAAVHPGAYQTEGPPF
jgi:hypothetical protein